MICLASHQSTYNKITCVKLFSVTEKPCYVSIFLKLSEGAAKIIYEKTFKSKDGSIKSKCQFICLCSSSSFSLIQQSWFAAEIGKLGTFKMREWGFFDQGGLNKKEIQLNLSKIFSIFIFNELHLFA